MEQNNRFIGVITGDIVNSRNEKPEIWLNRLKAILLKYGKSPKKWEVFRGDMFQLEVAPKDCLEAAIRIKASVKREKEVDVRVGVGIGRQGFRSKKITESNGEAFVNSGKSFEKLSVNRLAICTPWPDFNEEWNLYLELASLAMDNWSPRTAMIVNLALGNPGMNQKELGEKINRSQSTISEGLSRAGYNEIMKMIDRFHAQVKDLNKTL